MNTLALALILGSIGTVVSVLTLIILIMRGVLSVESRLTRLETQMEPYTEGLKGLVVSALKGIIPGSNPIDPSRYQYLLDRMNSNVLTRIEAQELNTALLELQQEASQSKDFAKLLLIGFGLLILAAILKNN